MTIDRHTLALISIAGSSLDVLGALYLAYDLLGGEHGPLRTVTRGVTYGALFGAGYGFTLGPIFGLATGLTHGLTLAWEYARASRRGPKPGFWHDSAMSAIRGLGFAIGAGYLYGATFGAVFGTLSTVGQVLAYRAGIRPTLDYQPAARPRLTRHQLLAAINRTVGYTFSAYISAFISQHRANALELALKAGLIIGVVTAIVNTCTPFIEWSADRLPEKRMGVFGIGLRFAIGTILGDSSGRDGGTLGVERDRYRTEEKKRHRRRKTMVCATMNRMMAAELDAKPRYQFKAGRYSSHTLLLARFPERGEGRRVLDLGCAAGYLSEILAERGFSVTCIDWPGTPHPATVEFSGADLDNGIGPVGGYFEYIICADLIEHLRDPLRLLKECREKLAPGGTLVASLPNSAHWYFRWNVLRGRFPQHERGLFDSTHLHFYPWIGWVNLLNRAGFGIESVCASSVPFGLALPKWDGSWLVRSLERLSVECARVWKTLFAYQFIVTARGKDPVER